jgi:LCP family protein required for cell wall assembly
MSYLPRDADGEPVGTRGERRHERRHSTRRFLGLTALGTVIPGAGLSFTKRRTTGLVVLAGFIVGLVVLLANIGSQGLKASVIDLAVTPERLVFLTVAIIVCALVWIASIVLTSHQTEPRGIEPAQSWLLRGFTLLMCLVVLVPSVQAVRLLSVHRSLLNTVFKGKSPSESHANPHYARPDVHNEQAPWANTPRVNILLLGSDAGTDRVGIRTDSMIIASVDTKSGNTVLVSVPRNLQDVPFPKNNPLHELYPNGYDCGSQCLMNAVWTLAGEHQKLFPGNDNPGLTTTQQVLTQVTGLPIDYTLIVDLHGFSSLVNAMGGVNIDVKERLPIGGKVENGAIAPGSIKGWIEPGKQHLDGHQALWYSRSRATTDDFSRMRRQRCMVGAIVDQVNPVTMVEKYPRLASVLKKNLQTDISQKELKAFVTLVERMQKGTMKSLAFTNDNTNTVHPDFAKMHQLVQKAIHPPKPPKKKSNGQGKAGSTPKSTPTSSPSPTKTQNPDSAVDVNQAC